LYPIESRCGIRTVYTAQRLPLGGYAAAEDVTVTVNEPHALQMASGAAQVPWSG